MPKRFVPLSFNLIEEGRLAASVDESLAELTRKLIDHVKKYGADATVKSKAELAIKVTIQFDGGDDAADYSVKGQITAKYPGRPSYVTKAVQDCEQTGEETLFVRTSGSDARRDAREARGRDQEGALRRLPLRAAGVPPL